MELHRAPAGADARFESRLVRSDGDGLVCVGLAGRGGRCARDERQSDGGNQEAGSSATHGTSVCWMLGRVVRGASPSDDYP